MPDRPDLSPILSALAAAAEALATAARAIAHQATPLPAPAPPPPLQRNPDAIPTQSPARQAATQVDLVDAVNSFLVAKARGGRSARYVRQLRVTLSSLVAAAGPGATLEALEAQDLERWAYGVKRWSARTRRGALLDARTFYAWAVRRGLCPRNPALGLELPQATAPPPRVHTPDQVAAVLAWCRAKDLDVMRSVAIRYFAGVRSAELLRMKEEHLHPDRGFLEVPAAAAKTRSRRIVTIQPALAAWLELGGTIPAGERRIREVVRGAGVPWPPNVTRHTFASMHLAAFANAARTALECGHAEAILFRHYRELVSPSESSSFWSLRPSQ